MPSSGSNVTRTAGEPVSSASFSLRPLGRQDIDEVIAIERRVFSSPWSDGMFALELAKPGGLALAAVSGEQIGGYLVMSRYDDAWHLMNVAVAPESRRSGIASSLISSAFAEIDEEIPVTLEVRPSNAGAIALYELLGFRPVAVRPGYYPNDGEDALIMWRGDPARAGVPAQALQGTGS
jgi:ribosomal-protein-alanine N-acetyltransferase